MKNIWSLFGIGVAMIALTSLSIAAGAGTHVNVTTGMTLAGAPLAVHGYDPVAYFTQNKPVLGQAEFTVTHDGAAYRFSSEANMKKFEQSPERYLPQYGGYCAFGTSVGAKFDGDPRIFAIVDGKLYFNLNPDIRVQWDKDRPGNIKKADANWKEIRDKDPRDLT